MSINPETIYPKVSQLCSLMALTLIVALGCFAEARAQWTTPDAAQNINNTNTGNVGIGTTTPGTSLDVAGNIINVGSEAGTKNRGNNTVKLSRIAMPPYTTANMRFALLGGATLSNANIVALGGEVGGMSAATQIDFFTAPTTNVDTGTLRMTINGAGNVGIGTSAPDVKFHLHHSSTNTNLGNIQLADLGMALRNTSNTNGNMTLISFQDSTGFGNAQLGAIQTDQTNHSADLAFFTRNGLTFGERLRIKSNGSIGIGTTTPTTAFHLNSAAAGYTTAGQFLITDSSNTNRHLRLGYDSSLEAGWIQASKVGTNYQPLLLNPNGANVGVGTTAPAARLDVSGTVNATAFTVSGTAVVSSQWATAGSTINYSNGNVGIATSTPTEKLHVTGNVKVTGNIDVGGNINAKYQDMAEWVESSQQLIAGTVVVLDSSKTNQVIASTSAYDSRVAGVISPQPGIVLGERGEGRVLVATTGRVKVKVDASNGPITVGDLLVTSHKTGLAMKSVPVEIGGVSMHRPGTLIGKALEPLAAGTGQILVLLSLQ